MNVPEPDREFLEHLKVLQNVPEPLKNHAERSRTKTRTQKRTMTQLIQIALIALIAYGHIKLYIDGGASVTPAKNLVHYDNRRPYGFAAFFDNGKFIKYLDLRQ